MTQQTTPITETNKFIVLEKYEKYVRYKGASEGYQSETQLENEFIQDLVNQGYEYEKGITNPPLFIFPPSQKQASLLVFIT